MGEAGQLITDFYDAVTRGDMASARALLAEDMTFLGLFETYPNADSYIATLTELMKIVTKLDILRVIAHGDDVAIFYEMHTGEPAPGVTLVAEWHETRDGSIVRARSAFDGRIFAAMFGETGAADGEPETVR